MSRRAVLNGIALLAAVVWLNKYLSSSFNPSEKGRSGTHSGQWATTLPLEYHGEEDGDGDSLNATLGFQQVFAINLPSRPDRRDELTLMAGLSQIDITFSDGVQYTHRSQLSKDLPPHSSSMPLGKLGCYRAHANVWQTIVERDISTALILEDDVDWDVAVRSSLAKLSGPLALLQETLSHGLLSNSHSLGRDRGPAWDILRLGTCLDPAHTKDSHRRDVDLTSPPYVLYQDDTVTPREHTMWEHAETLDAYGVPFHSSREKGKGELGEEEEEETGARHRILQLSNYPVCLHAYAVSNRGASKLLNLTGQGFIDDANDLTIARWTQRGLLNSFTVIPSLFGQWKVAGWQGNSDIKQEKTSLHNLMGSTAPPAAGALGSAFNIERSIREEAKRVLGASSG